MSFYDEAYSPSNAEFPLTDEAREFWDIDLDEGEKRNAKAPCRKWQLLDLRANGGFKAKDGTPKGVVNIRARGLDDEYAHTGEVAYWLEARRIDNERDPQRRVAGMLGQMFQALGLIPEDAKPKNGAEVLAQLVAAASRPIPDGVTFKAQLRWSKRAYKGNDGGVYQGTEHEFAFIDSVKAGDEADAPF